MSKENKKEDLDLEEEWKKLRGRIRRIKKESDLEEQVEESEVVSQEHFGSFIQPTIISGKTAPVLDSVEGLISQDIPVSLEGNVSASSWSVESESDDDKKKDQLYVGYSSGNDNLYQTNFRTSSSGIEPTVLKTHLLEKQKDLQKMDFSDPLGSVVGISRRSSGQEYPKIIGVKGSDVNKKYYENSRER